MHRSNEFIWNIITQIQKTLKCHVTYIVNAESVIFVHTECTLLQYRFSGVCYPRQTMLFRPSRHHCLELLFFFEKQHI
jgi:hypothetical protein